jgi:hypothetical protein
LCSVVAVHGIGADPDRTWTYSEKAQVIKPEDGGADHTKNARITINWLKDENMLPAAIPRARIMRFGYDSRWYGPDPVRQRLENIANSLLLYLGDARKASPSVNAP